MTITETLSGTHKAPHDRVLLLLRREGSDLQVASELGVSIEAVRMLRQKLGEPGPRRFAPHPLRAEARQLLRQGQDARAVTRNLGLRWSMVRRWAIELGLRPEDQREIVKARRGKAEAMLLAGQRPKVIVSACSVSRSALRGWARQLGLPRLVGRRPGQPSRTRAEAMLRSGVPVRDAAAAVGVPVDTVYQWKRHLSWPKGREAQAAAQAAARTEPQPEMRRHPRRDIAEQMLLDGNSTRKVAKALSVGPSTAWEWRRQLGLGGQ